ncbi:protocatechuate 3,4-dioxygenase subunit alpha [Patulibacter defluvii]|uniref:protocatechuate 3,4-dioxygenase subunit alpha n=1 Tax=Patulibacter defluvii TaxID=3095358 RepID=UPI002A74C12B|nr:protocatechuate 3,4-dioxygenase subunit alpha [Patulibacter sp. DM4]
MPTTPSQTVGPYLHLGLPWPDGPHVVPPDTAGAIVLHGQVLDGDGAPIPDALVESWQADPDGGFAHVDRDPRGSGDDGLPFGPFRGFGRSATDADGRYAITTLKPGRVPWPEAGGDGAPPLQAPHLALSVFARGLLHRVVSRAYFADEAAANADDPLLARVDPARRATLVAVPDERGYRLDLRLQGPDETVFFDL